MWNLTWFSLVCPGVDRFPIAEASEESQWQVQSNLNTATKEGGGKHNSFTYNAERVLGSGSFGIVYQAQVVETGESVAIKKVFQDFRLLSIKALSFTGMLTEACLHTIKYNSSLAPLCPILAILEHPPWISFCCLVVACVSAGRTNVTRIVSCRS
eukprot:959915-Amphidinium_carterae.2